MVTCWGVIANRLFMQEPREHSAPLGLLSHTSFPFLLATSVLGNTLCFLLGVCAGGNLAFFIFLKQKFSVVFVQKRFGDPILLGALLMRGNNSC